MMQHHAENPNLTPFPLVATTMNLSTYINLIWEFTLQNQKPSNWETKDGPTKGSDCWYPLGSLLRGLKSSHNRRRHARVPPDDLVPNPLNLNVPRKKDASRCSWAVC